MKKALALLSTQLKSESWSVPVVDRSALEVSLVVIVDAPAAIEQITALARPAAQQQLNLSKLYFALAFLQ